MGFHNEIAGLMSMPQKTQGDVLRFRDEARKLLIRLDTENETLHKQLMESVSANVELSQYTERLVNAIERHVKSSKGVEQEMTDISALKVPEGVLKMPEPRGVDHESSDNR
jgi:hypothetical protein